MIDRNFYSTIAKGEVDGQVWKESTKLSETCHAQKKEGDAPQRQRKKEGEE